LILVGATSEGFRESGEVSLFLEVRTFYPTPKGRKVAPVARRKPSKWGLVDGGKRVGNFSGASEQTWHKWAKEQQVNMTAAGGPEPNSKKGCRWGEGGKI